MMMPRSTTTGMVARAMPIAAMLAGASGSVLSRTSPLSGFVSVQVIQQRRELQPAQVLVGRRPVKVGIG